MTPLDSPTRTHTTADQHTTDRHLTALRRVTLAVGLLLVEWSTRAEAHSPAHAASRPATDRRTHTSTSKQTLTHADHETLIRRHRTQRTLEQEQQRAEARMLMAPLAW